MIHFLATTNRNSYSCTRELIEVDERKILGCPASHYDLRQDNKFALTRQVPPRSLVFSPPIQRKSYVFWLSKHNLQNTCQYTAELRSTAYVSHCSISTQRSWNLRLPSFLHHHLYQSGVYCDDIGWFDQICNLQMSPRQSFNLKVKLENAFERVFFCMASDKLCLE